MFVKFQGFGPSTVINPEFRIKSRLYTFVFGMPWQAASAIVKRVKDPVSGKVKVTGTPFLRATQTYPKQFCEEAAALHRALLLSAPRKAPPKKNGMWVGISLFDCFPVGVLGLCIWRCPNVPYLGVPFNGCRRGTLFSETPYIRVYRVQAS